MQSALCHSRALSILQHLQVGAEKELRTVIEGESLFNDGSAYVLFLLFRVNAIACIRQSACHFVYWFYCYRYPDT